MRVTVDRMKVVMSKWRNGSRFSVRQLGLEKLEESLAKKNLNPTQQIAETEESSKE